MKYACSLLVLLLISAADSGAETNQPVRLTIIDALARAAENNENLQQSRRTIRIAEIETRRAWQSFSPTVDLEGRYMLDDSSGGDNGPDSGSFNNDDEDQRWEASLQVSQSLVDLRRTPLRRRNYALEQVEREQYRANLLDRMTTTSRQFLNVLKSSQQIEVAKDSLELAERELDRARALFHAGEVRRSEVLLAEVDTARANRILTEATNSLRIAVSRLARELGDPPNTGYDIVEPEDDAGLFSVVVDENRLYEEAETNRFELAAARASIRAAEKQLHLSRDDIWPKVSLNYDHSYTDPAYPNSDADSWMLSIAATFEVWDKGETRFNRMRDAERLAIQELAYDELRKNVEIEIREALLAYVNLQTTLALSESEVALAEDRYKTLSEQAKVGLATSLDVSTALLELTRARNTYVNDRHDLAIAGITLLAAAGTPPAWMENVMEDYLTNENER